MSHPTHTSRKGFTLIELLTVIAIIGILAGIIIPTVNTVRTNAIKTQTKAMFSQWTLALEQFRQDYGYYPVFDGTAGKVDINANKDEFIGVLTGELPGEGGVSTMNTKRIRYYSFPNEAFETPGDDSTPLVDSFGNQSIFMAVDDDQDGKIESDDHETLRGSVVFYTVEDEAGEFEEIKSWE